MKVDLKHIESMGADSQHTDIQADSKNTVSQSDYPILSKAQILERLLARDVERGYKSLKDLPLPQALAHITEGAEIVANCIKSNQEVLVVGDYDADGVCASAIMVQFFRILGYANMRLIIPNRFTDGYGVSAALLQKYANNAAVVISVDNGITAFCAAQWCKEAQIPLVITDHHTPTHQLPEADVIIDPYLSECTFPQKSICGAVVAWYFCATLKQILDCDVNMSVFLPYLAIASVGDVMPLVGINRLLVKKGIESLYTTSMPFARLLREKYKKLDAQTLGFYIVPLLNAPGRMASADVALAFLVSEDLDKAQSAYERLLNLNNERKKIQSEVLESAHKHLIEYDDFVVSYAQGWHEGVLGIVASHLSREYQKSAFVFNEINNVLKGSGHSFGDVNLIASITPLADKLLGFGGHSGAMGLSVEKEKLRDFASSLCMVCEESEDKDSVLGKIESANIDRELLEIIEHFAPFGAGNPMPVLICEYMRIESIKPFGKVGVHFEYILRDTRTQTRLVCVEFFAPCMREVGQCGDVYCEIMRDDFTLGVKLKMIEGRFV